MANLQIHSERHHDIKSGLEFLVDYQGFVFKADRSIHIIQTCHPNKKENNEDEHEEYGWQTSL